jgi:pSer/pThr/pTyr-binding forkhead associated (FHA) protein
MHVALTLDEDGLVLIDLASTNGVFRDGAKIRHARVRDTEVFAFDADEVNRMRVTVHAGRR